MFGLLIRVLPRIAGYLPRILSFVGRLAWRHPIVTAAAVDYETGGAITHHIVKPVAESAMDGGFSKLEGTLKVAFNTFAQDINRNGLYAVVPVLAAVGALSGEGITGRLLLGIVMGALGFLAVRCADDAGYRVPGIATDFAAATSQRAAPGKKDLLAGTSQESTPANSETQFKLSAASPNW